MSSVRLADGGPAPAPCPVPLIDLKAQYATIRDEVQQTVSELFEQQAFVLGEPVAELEKEIAAYCDSAHAVGCASGTDALILSLMAAGVGPGDEVITSPFTFFATAGAIHRVGAKPVFVDIEPVGFNIDPEQIEAAVTPKTKAIMPVHIFGQCAEMEPIWRIAVRLGIPVIEDAAQAIGSAYRGRKAGVLGTTGCFSFFPTKNLGGAGDGGIITTDDPEVANRLRRLRVHGDVGGYNHVEVGFNSRLDALQAAVLRIKLRHLEDWSEARRQNGKRYAELFRHYELLDGVELPTTLPDRRHIFNQFVIRVPDGKRNEVQQSLRGDNIGCGIYYPIGLHMQKCFEFLGYKEGDMPECERACAEVLALPIYSELTASMQEEVVRGVSRALGRGANLPRLYASEQQGSDTLPLRRVG
ncbi:DegT/DnrJ/EryC1/StrS family aminotransferase [Stratiformator vulcanicus]|uniref:Aminotransferase n=1 Tax=Stratiformator vulcanicus TaxID=2527980 RepID=A0A517R2V2_9PLAN|nr:DegT/DnrJ/EryC1/StrS family aminotransferase [Stratiformator vulcanicus]QDT38173.1 Aminotransferase [Stratiformator vulcanicus]